MSSTIWSTIKEHSNPYYLLLTIILHPITSRNLDLGNLIHIEPGAAPELHTSLPATPNAPLPNATADVHIGPAAIVFANGLLSALLLHLTYQLLQLRFLSFVCSSTAPLALWRGLYAAAKFHLLAGFLRQFSDGARWQVLVVLLLARRGMNVTRGFLRLGKAGWADVVWTLPALAAEWWVGEGGWSVLGLAVWVWRVRVQAGAKGMVDVKEIVRGVRSTGVLVLGIAGVGWGVTEVAVRLYVLKYPQNAGMGGGEVPGEVAGRIAASM